GDLHRHADRPAVHGRPAAKPYDAAGCAHRGRVTKAHRMRIDISFLPALAAAFMLVFARIGTMVMLLPGLGELSVPVRVRLGVALIFTTDMHHLVIGALDDSYSLFAPGETPFLGDVAALTTRTVASAFRVGIQLSAPFIVFGLLFNLGLGVLSRLMPQMQVF